MKFRPDPTMSTARLRDAIRRDDVEGVRDALDAGAEVNDPGEDGYGPLAFINNIEICRMLLDAGADPNFASEGKAPDALFWATQSGRAAIVRLLLARGAKVSSERLDYDEDASITDWQSSVHAAADNGNIEILEALLTADGRELLNTFNYVSQTPLMIAVERANLPMIKMLIAAGSDVNATHEAGIGNPALRYAVQTRNSEIVRILMEAGADPGKTGWMKLSARNDAERLEEPLRSEMMSILTSISQKQG